MTLIAWGALAALLVDQVGKYLVISVMGLDRIGGIDILPPVLNFRYGENRGINFGLFAGDSEASRWLLILFAVLVCIAVLIWVRHGPARPMGQFGAGLLIGGALSNVLDRLMFGYVRDFLNTSCCGIDNPFVFNPADVFIFLGAAALILFDGRPEPKKAP